MTDERVKQVWDEMRAENMRPLSSVDPVRRDLAELFRAYPGREEAALRAVLGYVANNEWWQERGYVTLRFILANGKGLRYAEEYGLEEEPTPENVRDKILRAKNGLELTRVLEKFRPNGGAPVFIDGVPYALRFIYDEEFIAAHPGAFKLLDTKLIRAGDTVTYQGQPCTVERVVKHDLVTLSHGDSSALVSTVDLE